MTALPSTTTRYSLAGMSGVAGRRTTTSALHSPSTGSQATVLMPSVLVPPVLVPPAVDRRSVTACSGARLHRYFSSSEA